MSKAQGSQLTAHSFLLKRLHFNTYSTKFDNSKIAFKD